MKRSRLKNKTSRSKDPADIANYKKQRKIVKQSLSISKKFQIRKARDHSGILASRYFSKKHPRRDSNVVFIENGKMLLKTRK